MVYHMLEKNNSLKALKALSVILIGPMSQGKMSKVDTSRKKIYLNCGKLYNPFEKLHKPKTKFGNYILY